VGHVVRWPQQLACSVSTFISSHVESEPASMVAVIFVGSSLCSDGNLSGLRLN